MRKSSIVSTLSALSIACNAMDNKPKPQLLINPPPTAPADKNTETETSEKKTEKPEISTDQGDGKPETADNKAEAAKDDSNSSANEANGNDASQPK